MTPRPPALLLGALIALAATAPACSRSKAEGAAPAEGATPAAAATPTPTSAKEGSTEASGEGAVTLCEHGAPAELCTRCDPDLVAVFKESGDWCNEHQVPESQCKQCNPALDFTKQASTGPKEPYCGEHGVPEAKCTKCRPQLVAQFVAAGDYCREHGLPESVCPYCHPEVARAAGVEPPVFPPPDLRVRLARADIAAAAGLQTQVASPRPYTETLEVVGQLDFNHNRLAQLSARGEALVTEVKVDLGDVVKAGQPLVLLASAGVGESQGRLSAARARLTTARAALQREEALQARGISSQREVEEARAQLAEAQGEAQAASAGLGAAGAGAASSGGRYALSAPFAGVVVGRSATAGKSASAGDTLVEVADVSTLWALLEVPEESASRVKPGQRVLLRLEGGGGGGREVEARVARVAAAVDRATRTVRVRVDVPNPDGALKAGTFLRARIEVSGAEEALLLPRDAVQTAEGHTLVFVRTGEGEYTPKAVEARAAPDGRMAILKGLTPGAEVVTTGAFLLKTEILKDSIGAGCADD